MGSLDFILKRHENASNLNKKPIFDLGLGLGSSTEDETWRGSNLGKEIQVGLWVDAYNIISQEENAMVLKSQSLTCHYFFAKRESGLETGLSPFFEMFLSR